MRSLIAKAALWFMVPALASAQGTDTDHPPRGLGYVFAGGATHRMSLTAGLGGEVYSSTGLGIGLEAGTGGVAEQRSGYFLRAANLYR
jgi:hypothetical protein